MSPMARRAVKHDQRSGSLRAGPSVDKRTNTTRERERTPDIERAWQRTQATLPRTQRVVGASRPGEALNKQNLTTGG